MTKLTQNGLLEIPGIESSGVETMSWRRTGHDSSAVPVRPQEMLARQPQDGALNSFGDRSFGDRRINALRSIYPSLTGEPEDARLTGGTRSLMRRVMGLNVVAPLRSAARRSVRRASTIHPQVA
jgi:hypothetical protein